MNKISCIIVDDEPLARKGLELNVKDLDWLELKGQFPNAIKADEFLSSHSIDLMFLDIEMPGINGIDYLKSLKVDTQVILTTAYPQFALEAFELDVVDYLMKPIRFERFFKAVNKARDFIELRQQGQSEIEEITDDFFYIKSDRKFIKLYFKEVLYIKGMKDYVMIFTETKKYMTALNIKTIFSQLPTSIFARVSKSYLINVDRIESIDIDSIIIGKEEIPLGNSYKEAFLKKYVKGNDE